MLLVLFLQSVSFGGTALHYTSKLFFYTTIYLIIFFNHSLRATRWIQFHRVANNGRRRRNTIISLVNGGKIIERDENLLSHATEYYKKLFGTSEGNSFPLDPDLWRESEEVLNEDNNWLVGPFSEEDIKFALF